MTGRVKSISNRDLKSFSDLRFSLEILLVTIWISIASYITENFPHHWVQYLLNQKSSDLTVPYTLYQMHNQQLKGLLFEIFAPCG